MHLREKINFYDISYMFGTQNFVFRKTVVRTCTV